MAEMRTRAIFGVLLAVTAIFVGLAALPPAQAAPKWDVVMTHSNDPFEGDKFIRGPEAARGNHWDINITNTGDETTSGPVTFTDVLPPGVKVVGIGYGTFGAAANNLPHARRSPKSTKVFPLPAPCTLNRRQIRWRARTDPTGTRFTGDVVRRRSPPGLAGHAHQRIHAVRRRRTHRDGQRLGRSRRHGTVPRRKVRSPHHDGLRSPDSATENNPGLECCEGPKINYQPLFTVAGGHPPGTTMNRFTFAQYPADEQLKDSVVRLPPGFFGNPAAAPRCPIAAHPSRPSVRVPRRAGSARLSAGLQNRHGGTLHPRFLRGRADKAALQRHAGPRIFRPVRGQRLRQRIFAVCGSAAAKRGVRPDDRVDERRPVPGSKCSPPSSTACPANMGRAPRAHRS